MAGTKLSLIRSKLNDRRFLIAYGEVIDEMVWGCVSKAADVSSRQKNPISPSEKSTQAVKPDYLPNNLDAQNAIL